MIGTKYTSEKKITWIIDNMKEKSFVLTSSDGRYIILKDLKKAQEIVNSMDPPDIIEQIFEDIIGEEI